MLAKKCVDLHALTFSHPEDSESKDKKMQAERSTRSFAQLE